jgi:hypothetical protein
MDARERLVEAMAEAYGEKGCDDEDDAPIAIDGTGVRTTLNLEGRLAYALEPGPPPGRYFIRRTTLNRPALPAPDTPSPAVMEQGDVYAAALGHEPTLHRPPPDTPREPDERPTP